MKKDEFANYMLVLASIIIYDVFGSSAIIILYIGCCLILLFGKED